MKEARVEYNEEESHTPDLRKLRQLQRKRKYSNLQEVQFILFSNSLRSPKKKILRVTTIHVKFAEKKANFCAATRALSLTILSA